MAAPVVLGIGAAGGTAAAAPVIVASLATMAVSAAAAKVFGPGCEKGMDMYEQKNCKNAGYFDFVCAMVTTYAVSNCAGLGAAAGAFAIATVGMVKDEKSAALLKRFIGLGIKQN